MGALMRVSVITAVKDNVAELACTLDGIVKAVAAEPAVQVQLLVVAPGIGATSTAALLDILAAAQKQHDDSIVDKLTRLTIQRVFDDGTGIAAAFNTGLQHCRGDMIAVLNAGDLWFPDTLVNVARAAKESPGAVLYSSVTFENEQGQRYVVDSDPERVHVRMTLFHPTLFVPAAVYARVGNYSDDYRLAMDSHWCHRARSLDVAFHDARSSLAIMRLGGASDSGFALALDEFCRSVVEAGLMSPPVASFHCVRIKLAKRFTHLPFVRRLQVWWRATAQPSEQQ